jgi:hypothetical protein
MNNQTNRIQYNQFYLDIEDNNFLAEQYYPTLKNVKNKLYQLLAVLIFVSVFELYILFLYIEGSDPTFVRFSILPSMIFIAQLIFSSLDFYNIYKNYQIYKSLFNKLTKS